MVVRLFEYLFCRYGCFHNYSKKLYQKLFSFFAAEVTKLTNLKGDAVFTPLKDSRTNACVTDTSAYVCDFSSPCQFGGTSDSQWYTMDGYPDYQTWTDSVGTPTSSSKVQTSFLS